MRKKQFATVFEPCLNESAKKFKHEMSSPESIAYANSIVIADMSKINILHTIRDEELQKKTLQERKNATSSARIQRDSFVFFSSRNCRTTQDFRVYWSLYTYEKREKRTSMHVLEMTFSGN